MSKTIYTHNGKFHADDVFAVAAAKLAGFGPNIIRVKELPENFSSENGDVAIDIGRCHNPANSIFDHHQKGGNDDGLAAIGKFWNAYGVIICYGSKIISKRVWDVLLQWINDSDIGKTDWNHSTNGRLPISASGLIEMMNPPTYTPDTVVDVKFSLAVTAAAAIIIGAIEQAEIYKEMYKVVNNATYHFNKKVMQLSTNGQWQEYIFEQELNGVLYVIYPSDRGGFHLKCVPDKLGSFGKRKSLPKEWSGLKGEELSKITNVPSTDSILFCHPDLFVAGAETLENVLALAELAVNN
jgi:uncharacterized UPF0160 family protein